MKKIFAMIAAALMGIALVLSPMGSGVTALAAGGTITVTPPTGTESTTSTTYKLYKVFVAVGNGTNIRYNTVNVGDEIENVLHSKGWTVPDVSKYVTGYDETSTAHFILDTTGNVHWGTVKSGATATRSPDDLSDTYSASDINDIAETNLPTAAISAIKDYVSGDQPIDTESTTGVTPVTFSNLDTGYYYITTTTGSLAIVDSNNSNVNITDKNSAPTVDKTITGVDTGSVDGNGKNAIAQVGSTVSYQVTVNFQSGNTKVKLHDTLGTGLSLVTDPAPAVKFYTSTDESAEATVASESYTIRTGNSADNGESLTIDFDDALDDSITHAVVTYQATVNSDALFEDPATNSAHATYGDNNATTTDQHTNVYNAKYTVTKTDGDNNALAGAGFVLRKATPAAENTYEYYKYDSSTNAVSWISVAPAAGETYEIAARNAATAGTITQLTTTDGDGGNVVTFTGLSDGTYELYELTVPDGYMRASNVTFTVQDATVTTTNTSGTVPFTAANLQQSTTVINRTGSELPSTGGIGTTIFYIIGGVLVAGAAVLLVMRRKRA